LARSDRFSRDASCATFFTSVSAFTTAKITSWV
jgi:hypothetical protein